MRNWLQTALLTLVGVPLICPDYTYNIECNIINHGSYCVFNHVPPSTSVIKIVYIDLVFSLDKNTLSDIVLH